MSVELFDVIKIRKGKTTVVFTDVRFKAQNKLEQLRTSGGPNKYDLIPSSSEEKKEHKKNNMFRNSRGKK